MMHQLVESETGRITKTTVLSDLDILIAFVDPCLECSCAQNLVQVLLDLPGCKKAIFTDHLTISVAVHPKMSYMFGK